MCVSDFMLAFKPHSSKCYQWESNLELPVALCICLRRLYCVSLQSLYLLEIVTETFINDPSSLEFVS